MFLLYDIDEYLEFVDENMTLRNYLEMPVFNKCEVIKIHWMIYDDNNLIYYDNRTLKERFTHALPDNSFNIYHKSIIRGKNYDGILFSDIHSLSQPNESITIQCDAIGNIEILGKYRLGRPNYKYCFIKHYTYKTAEEFAVKLLKGLHQGKKYEMERLIDYFSKVNNLTNEKLRLIEIIVNRTFQNFHKNKNQL